MRTYGGTSNHWGGWDWSYEFFDLNPRPIRPQHWPTQVIADLPYYWNRNPGTSSYDSAQKICQLGPFKFDDPEYWVKEFSTPERPLEQMPLGGTGMKTRVLQYNSIKFEYLYGPAVENSSNIDIYRNANFIRFETTSVGGKQHVNKAVVKPIVCRSGNPVPCKEVNFEADYFVLAAGGIESTRLLLLSGLGNSSGHLGKTFMDHPYSWNLRSIPVLGNDKIPQGVKNFYFSQNPIPLNNGKGTTFGAALVPTEDFINDPSNPIGDFRILLGGLGNWFTPGTVSTNTEFLPHPNSYISLSDQTDFFGQRKVKLDWAETPTDRQTVRTAATAAKNTLEGLGYGTVTNLPPLQQNPWDWPSPWSISMGLHPMGSTRMSAQEKDGVVNTNMRVWDTANLYVASSSTFPTSGGYVNPTYSICALAIRLADFLMTKPN
ncbi:MAG: GMC family oxidoreductase [Acidobacteriota bacterium]